MKATIKKHFPNKVFWFIILGYTVTHRRMWFKGEERTGRFGGGWDIECGIQYARGGGTLIINSCFSTTRIEKPRFELQKFYWFQPVSEQTLTKITRGW